MSKGYSDLFSGTKGDLQKKSTKRIFDSTESTTQEIARKDAVSKIISAFTENGTLTADSLHKNASVFVGNTVETYIEALELIGYIVETNNSKKSRSGAKIIKIKNESKNKNISQLQVPPGGGRHGSSPYVKISTNDIGKYKIVDGSITDYKQNADETAEIIFIGDL